MTYVDTNRIDAAKLAALSPEMSHTLFDDADSLLFSADASLKPFINIFANQPQDIRVKYLENNRERIEQLLYICNGSIDKLPFSWQQALNIAGSSLLALTIDLKAKKDNSECISQRDLECIVSAFPKLQSFSLCNCQTECASDKSLLTPVTQLAELSRLDLTGCSDIDNSGIAPLALLPQLDELILDELHLVDNEGIKLLHTLKQLTTLSLTDCHVDDHTIALISAKHPLLQQLFVNLTEERKNTTSGNLTNEGLAHLRKLTNLTLLNLSGRKGFAQEDLSFLDQLKNIKVQLL